MATAVEAAIVLPVMMLLVGLVVVLAGRALAQQAVSGAAFSAARAASLERKPGAADRAARDMARVDLGSSRVTCESVSVSVDASGLAAPRGAPAFVEVWVSCVAVFPVSLPGLPERATITGHGRSPVDTFRSRRG